MNKVFIVRKFPESSAVGQDNPGGITPVPYTLILPLPDCAAKQRFVFVENIIVFAYRSHRIEHRMGVLAHVKRFCVSCVGQSNGFNLRDICIHAAVEVGRIGPANSESFIVNRPCIVNFLHGGHRGPEVRPSPSVLVPERPDYYRRMVFEIFRVGHIPVDNSSLHSGLLIKPSAVSVTLDIGLGNKPYTILIA